MKKCLTRRDLSAHVHIAGVFCNFGILVILGRLLTPENTLFGWTGYLLDDLDDFWYGPVDLPCAFHGAQKLPKFS
jgi:hypothetical protein